MAKGKGASKQAGKGLLDNLNSKALANRKLSISLIAGVAITLLGAVVMFGWYTKNTALLQINPAFVPMQFNTALGFLLSGLGLLSIVFNRSRLAIVLGSLAALLGALTMVEYVAGISLGIDQMFMEGYITVKTSHPGRMAPNTAVSFFLIGTALIIFGQHFQFRSKLLITNSLVVLTFALASVSILGYALGVEAAYGWGNLTRMALHTSIGFLIIGFGTYHLALLRLPGSVRERFSTLMVTVFIGGLTISVGVWQGITSQEATIFRNGLEDKVLMLTPTIDQHIKEQNQVVLREVDHLENRNSGLSLDEARDIVNLVEEQPGLLSIAWVDSLFLVRWEETGGKPGVFSKNAVVPEINIADLEQARDSKTRFVTTANTLPGQEPAILVFQPIYNDAGFDGFVLEALELKPLLADVLSYLKTTEVDISISSNGILLFQTFNGQATPPDEWLVTRNFNAQGLPLNLSLWANENTGAQSQSIFPTLILILGILLSGGAVLLLNQLFKTKQTSAKLEAAKGKLQLSIDSMFDGLVVMDEKGIIQSVNQRLCAIFGYKKQELIGQDIKILMPEEDAKKHRSYVKHYLTKKKSVIKKPVVMGVPQREVIGKYKTGRPIILECSINIFTENDQQFLVGTLRDITEKKKVEEKLKQAQKMEAVGNLSGGIAHDFNNILTAIRGSLQLFKLVEKDISDEARNCLSIAIKSTRRGGDLTHRLLAFSRKQTLKPSVVEVNDLVRNLMPMFKRTIDESIEIKAHLMEAEAFVSVDMSELENSLLNLTVNAKDAMPDGGHLTFEVEQVEVRKVKAGEREIEPGKYVVLSVSDNGSGMPSKVRDRVFEPFFSTKGVEKGSGLGLSMVYGFVKQSGGHITVYSEVGKGTTFKLYLKATGARKKFIRAKKTTLDLKVKGTGTILLVEDDENVRQLITQALKVKGYTVFEVADGPSAVLVMDRDEGIDLLLTDVVLPKGISGPEIGKEFEKRFPGRPIIYSSGYTGKAIKRNGWLREGEELLSKPYDLDVLFERVQSSIRRKT